MSDFKRIFDPVAPVNDWAVMQDFYGWHPMTKYLKEEEVGAVSWTGGELKTIKANASLPQVDLPAKLKELLNHCWQNAETPAPGSPRSGIMMGGHRPPPGPGATPPPSYMKMVSPTTPPMPAAMAASRGLDLGYLDGLANDWGVHQHLGNRINAYTFRGDTRAPGAIRAAKGFFPPITRTDRAYVEGGMFAQFKDYMKRRFNKDLDKQVFLKAYDKVVKTDDAKELMWDFSVWRSYAESESMHLGRMLANEALKGYISTTRATVVAKGFAKSGGWVYVTLIKGGYVVPPKAKHDWTSIFGEQEIALPGSLAWSDVMGFRQIDPTGPMKFTGPLFLRKDFDHDDKDAFQAVYKLLCGKKQ